MGERMNASITIGGTVGCVESARLLVEAILRDGFGTDWGEEFHDFEDCARFCAEVGKDTSDLLYLYSEEAEWGVAAEIESACRELEFPYTRCCEGNDEWGAYVELWDPVGGTREMVSDKDGRIMVPLDTIESLLEPLKGSNLQRAQAIRSLDDLCAPLRYERTMPPFRWTLTNSEMRYLFEQERESA